MSDLLNDYPLRRSLKTKAESRVVFFITDLDIFMKRDERMKVKPAEVSPVIIDALKAKWPGATYVVILTPEQANHPAVSIGSHGLDNFHKYVVNPNQVGETTAGLIKFLKDLRIEFTPIRNPRTVSYLNIDKFIKSPKLTKIEANDYDKLGIEPDKDPSFQDLAKKRLRDAWP